MSIVTRGLAGNNLVLWGLGAWLLVQPLPTDEVVVYARLNGLTAEALIDQAAVTRVVDQAIIRQVFDAIDSDAVLAADVVYRLADALEVFRRVDGADVYMVAADGLVVYKITETVISDAAPDRTAAFDPSDMIQVDQERDIL